MMFCVYSDMLHSLNKRDGRISMVADDGSEFYQTEQKDILDTKPKMMFEEKDGPTSVTWSANHSTFCKSCINVPKSFAAM